MALPDTDLGWVDLLGRLHDAERRELENLDRYYEGTQPLSYMHPEIARMVDDRIQPVIIAWPQLVVDTVEERLDVEGFRLPDSDSGEDEIWQVWQSNDMDEQSQMGRVDALTMRRSYLTVGTNEDDPDTPLSTAESPLEMYVYTDPRTRKPLAALRRVVEQDSIARVAQRRATLYLPDRTVWFDWRDNQWAVDDQDEHGLGALPVVPVVNRPRLTNGTRLRDGKQGLRMGRSDLEQIIPLSDAANKIATDMVLAAEFVALPLRGAWGVSPGDMVDENGNKMTALQAIMGRFLAMANPEGREFQWSAASLDNFHNSINSLARIVAAVAGLPPHNLGFSTDNPASADAIRSAESRLVKRAERKQVSFGGSYEQWARIVRRFQSGDWDPRLKRLETVWRDASTPTVAQSADATVKKFQTRIITRRQARQDLGYTDAQIRLMESDDETEAARDPVGQIARQMAQGGPQEPADPAGEDVEQVTAGAVS